MVSQDSPKVLSWVRFLPPVHKKIKSIHEDAFYLFIYESEGIERAEAKQDFIQQGKIVACVDKCG